MAFRRVILSSRMMMISGQIQREGEVVHLVSRTIVDYSNLLATVGERSESFKLPHNRGDEFFSGEGGGRPDPRSIKVATRDFR